MRIRRSFTLLLSVFICLLTGGLAGSDEDSSAEPTAGNPDLSFSIEPIKPVFRVGEGVVFRFRLKNVSSRRLFVSRYMPIGDFVTLQLMGPDGKEVPWSGKIRSVEYNKDAFLMLNPGQEVSTSHTISIHDREGFLINKPGRYTIHAEYDLGPPEYFANVAPKGSIPEGPFSAPTVHFTIAASKEDKP